MVVAEAGADCITCATALIPQTPDSVDPFFGMSNVTVYLDDDARARNNSGLNPQIDVLFDARRVEQAIDDWASTCSGYKMPTLTLNLEDPPPSNRDPRTTIIIDYEPDVSGGTSPNGDLVGWADGTHIYLYGECETNISNCDAQGRFFWGSDHGQQMIEHEIGHTLGLFHDKASCKKPGLMAASSWADQTLQITDEYCQLASKLNDWNQTCGLQAYGASVHPCQLCSHNISGSVDGLQTS